MLSMMTKTISPYTYCLVHDRIDEDRDVIRFANDRLQSKTQSFTSSYGSREWKSIDGAWKAYFKGDSSEKGPKALSREHPLPEGKRGDLVGLLLWRREYEVDGTDCAYITNLDVIETHRRKGIAKRLMYLAINDWKKHKIWRYELHARVDNTAAITLYKKFGFQVDEKIEGFYNTDYDLDIEPEDYDDSENAYSMVRVTSRIGKKMQSPKYEKNQQTSEDVRFGTTEFYLYVLSPFGGTGGYGWKIDFDDHGLIDCYEYDKPYNCAIDAFQACKRHFEQNKHELEKEAVLRRAEYLAQENTD